MIRQKLYLREERDFGQKFNAVFTFVQTNLKPFLKVIGLTVGPLALVGGFFFGLFYTKVFGMIRTNLTHTDIGGTATNFMGWGAEMILSYIVLILASLWMMIAVYAFMAEYDSGNENITIEAVWKRGKSKILPAIGFMLLIVTAMIIFVALFAFLAGDFLAGGNSGWIVAFSVLLVFGAIFYVMIPLSLVLPDMIIGNSSVFKGIGRSFELIRGKWWSTFGLFMVMSFISYVATIIFAIPLYISLIINIFMQTSAADTLTVIGSCIVFLGSILMTTLPALAIGFQYFNLVERKEGPGLLKKIDLLGKQVETANEGDF